MKLLKILSYSILFLSLIGIFYLSSTMVRHGEMNFFNDVARDFLLFNELNQKKIVLIGARSSTNGLFHGPLWSYINYPAFVLGNGNPMVVAWFWIFLEGTFLITSFFIAKNLFGAFPAYIYMLLNGVRLSSHMGGIFHAEAAIFFAPFFIFTIYKYLKEKKRLYLALHFLASSFLAQMNIGVGVQFLILSLILVLWVIVKNKLWKHLFTLFLLPVFLSNFIIFDLHNGLRMLKALASTGGSLKFFITISSWIQDRINNIISLQLFEDSTKNKVLFLAIFILVMALTIIELKKKSTKASKYRLIYFLFIFYYFGYMIFSFMNKGILLFHYTYLLVPITALWLVSFLSGKYKLLFLPIIALILYFNYQDVAGYVNARVEGIGTYPNSWRGLSDVASYVENKEQGKEFGYFVFAPDALAYQPRYAMIYNFKANHAKAFEYVKKPTTYIIAAPPPPDDPYMTYVWWRKNSVKISSQPLEVKKFPNGFTVEKLNLSKEEQKMLHDKTIELGIHFR